MSLGIVRSALLSSSSSGPARSPASSPRCGGCNGGSTPRRWWRRNSRRVLCAARPGVPAGLSDDVLRAVREFRVDRCCSFGSGLDLDLERPAIEFEACATASSALGATLLPVDADFFATLGIAVQRGRGIGPDDTSGSPRVAVMTSGMPIGVAWRGSVGPSTEKRPDVDGLAITGRWRGARRHDDQGRRDGRSGLCAGYRWPPAS